MGNNTQSVKGKRKKRWKKRPEEPIARRRRSQQMKVITQLQIRQKKRIILWTSGKRRCQNIAQAAPPPLHLSAKPSKKKKRQLPLKSSSLQRHPHPHHSSRPPNKCLRHPAPKHPQSDGALFPHQHHKPYVYPAPGPSPTAAPPRATQPATSSPPPPPSSRPPPAPAKKSSSPPATPPSTGPTSPAKPQISPASLTSSASHLLCLRTTMGEMVNRLGVFLGGGCIMSRRICRFTRAERGS